MFSIEEAKSAHTHATYNIPAGVRREWGSEAIIRELEAEATAVHHARMGKLRNAVMDSTSESWAVCRNPHPSHKSDPEAALRTGD